MAKKADLDSPDLYLNRELSWLEFNDRVLREGLSKSLPLMERLKFLSIVSSNLDEFFMIRVAGLMQQRSAGVTKTDLAGLTSAEQLSRISERVHRMVAEQSRGIRECLSELAGEGLAVLGPAEWTPMQQRFLGSQFAGEIQPIVTPLSVQDLDPPPVLPGLRLNVAVVLSRRTDGGGAVSGGADAHEDARIVVIPVPGALPRFITMPSEQLVEVAMLEDVIAANAGQLFPGCVIEAACVFRFTRDADVAIEDDDAADLLGVVEEAVLARRRRATVRLSVSAGADPRIRDWLAQWLDLDPEDVYEIDGMLDATSLMELATRPGFERLTLPEWPPQAPRDLVGADDLWAAMRERDVLLFHPYESFQPVVRLLEEAAADPQVLAIKQTLYRTSGDSPVIRALERAADSGKQVTVLVELKARFDESRNVNWARRLEDSGCHVIYGVAGLKTHAKAILVVRREGGRIRRYAHLGTGNYNDRTARLYSDIGLLTTDRDTGSDVAAFFNLLTGYSEAVGWSELSIAPVELRRRFIELIEREISASTPDRAGLIMAKVNSLQDKRICKALYGASRAGVKVMLNVRGICCLRPGVKHVSDNVEVVSIVDRFLEHARVFYFSNGGHEEVYLSSADWMARNLDRRLEILFPVKDPNLRRRLIGALVTYFADNVKSRRLRADGTYELTVAKGAPLRAQEKLYQEALEAVRSAGAVPVRFRPLMRPEQ